jgi:hypothetical protein
VTGASQLPSALRILDPLQQTWSVSDPAVVDGASAAMFDTGEVIKAGTASDSGGSGPAASNAYTADLSATSPRWTQTGSMQFPRSFVNLTALPDGTVLATGGETTPDGNNPANAVLSAEDWSPSSGAWKTWAAEATPRLYHSTAILLPDARVFVSGTGDDPLDLVPDNKTSEIFSPPYLFIGPCPVVTAGLTQVSYGSSFTVSTPDAASIRTVALIRTGNTTHFFRSERETRTAQLYRRCGLADCDRAEQWQCRPARLLHALHCQQQRGAVGCPVRSDQIGSPPSPSPSPTLLVGSATVQSGQDSDSPGQAEALQYTASTSSMVGSLSVYLDPSSAASTVYVGLYKRQQWQSGRAVDSGQDNQPCGGFLEHGERRRRPGNVRLQILAGPPGTHRHWGYRVP